MKANFSEAAMQNPADFDSLHNISSPQHLYQFYKSAEDYIRIMLAYFEAGLTKGEACLWLVSEKISIRSVDTYLQQNLARYNFYTSTGQLKIYSAEDWYLSEGVFDEEKALVNGLKYYQRVRSEGFEKLRVTGDAGAVPKRDWERLHRYEDKVGKLVNQSQIIALCAYPILECSIADTRSVLEKHDAVLVGRI